MQQAAANFKLARGKMLTDAEAAAQTDYKRYAFVADGSSPRTIPGQQGGIHLAGSDEHDEKGLYNEEADNRKKMMDKRFKKLDTAITAGEFEAPAIYGNADAPLTIVGFGSTKLPILEAMKWLARENIHVNYLQVAYLSPFPFVQVTDAIKKAKQTLVIENNMHGQFEGLVREQTGLSINHNLRKYDGRPFYPEEIVARIKEVLSV
jgi:2-oxoglutarate ferredoxin oxidoreductase subunit alpha